MVHFSGHSPACHGEMGSWWTSTNEVIVAYKAILEALFDVAMGKITELDLLGHRRRLIRAYVATIRTHTDDFR